MKNIGVLVFLLIILSSMAISENIQVAGEANILYTENTVLEIPNADHVLDINISEFIIAQDSRQKIENIGVNLFCGDSLQNTTENCENIQYVLKDTNEGKKIQIFGEKPEKYIKYIAKIRMKTKFDEPRIVNLFKNNLPSYMHKYLSTTKNIEVDNNIITLANSITNRSNPLDILIDITKWVHKTIHYNKEFGKVERTAKQTIEEKQGTCDEITNVEIALLRAKNIPARYVSGFAYSGTEWERHAWAEAYIGGVWVPVDPTFYEIGHIDVNHIAISKTKDYVDCASKIYWHTTAESKPIQEKVNNWKIQSTTKDINLFYGEISTPRKVHYKDTFNVNISLQNMENQYMVLPLTLYVYDTFTYLDNKEKIVVLSPLETTKINWKIKAPADQNAIYLYDIKIKALDKILQTKIQTSPPENKIKRQYADQTYIYIVICVVIVLFAVLQIIRRYLHGN